MSNLLAAIRAREAPIQEVRVVVEGTFEKDLVFKTNRLMVSHSNEYRPPKPGEDTKEWQKSLEISAK